MNHFIEFLDAVDRLFDHDDQDLRQAKMRRDVARDNKRSIRSYVFANHAPTPSRLEPRADLVVLR